MIKIDEIHIEEFRGIRSLAMGPHGNSLLVSGPNGSGKSGVVDALTFALTGHIPRLEGSGTGNVSPASHGAHALIRDDPEASNVRLTLRDTVSGATAQLTRAVKSAKRPKFEPVDSPIAPRVQQTLSSPQVALSRREIVDFILTGPVERSQQIQKLLKLDRIEAIRGLLRQTQTLAQTAYTSSQRAEQGARLLLENHLPDAGDLEGVRAAINAARTPLGLEELAEVASDTVLNEGVETSVAPTVVRATALADLDELHAMVEGAAIDTLVKNLTAAREPFADGTLARSLKHFDLATLGMDLIHEARCPLCDTEWTTIEELRAHIEAKVVAAKAAKEAQTKVEAAARALSGEYSSNKTKIEPLARLATALGLVEQRLAIDAWLAELGRRMASLSTFAGAQSVYDSIASNASGAPAEIGEIGQQLQARVLELPDLSADLAAVAFLTLAEERWSALRTSVATLRGAAQTRTRTNAAYAAFTEAATYELSQLYREVEADFARFYAFINADDEAGFEAHLVPESGALGLEVAFYGLGDFPPAAYHSEGHQDGMGLCLYLALARRLFGDDFSVCVLDDVVMSVDRDHRLRVCDLLRDEFPEVQFIITTHDPTWAHQILKSGLVSSGNHLRFEGWTLELGPRTFGDDLWARIEDFLDRGEVPSAAHALRRLLETSGGDIADSLRAPLPYRADGYYGLDFVPAVLTRQRRLLKKAKESANSWGKTEAVTAITERETSLAKSSDDWDEGAWALNAMIHHNDWASVGSKELRRVVTAARTLLENFKCSEPSCESWFGISEGVGPTMSLRCRCGETNLDLLVR